MKYDDEISARNIDRTLRWFYGKVFNVKPQYIRIVPDYDALMEGGMPTCLVEINNMVTAPMTCYIQFAPDRYILCHTHLEREPFIIKVKD